jgi:D-sedoheptulose 7-phosphate isomerase
MEPKINPVIEDAFKDHAALLAATRDLFPQIQEASNIVIESLKDGGTIMLCGNGGSAADAQHLAGELVGRFYLERRALPALALHANTTIVTAIGNDYSFDAIYRRQVLAHGRPGDVLIGITTSGTSRNIIEAAEAARELGVKVIGLTGKTGGSLAPLCNLCLCVPSTKTPRIQEMHILIGHLICQLAEAALA